MYIVPYLDFFKSEIVFSMLRLVYRQTEAIFYVSDEFFINSRVTENIIR